MNLFAADELRAVLNGLVAYRCTAGKTEKSLTRDSINQCRPQLRKMFAWAVGRRVMEPATEQALHEARPLRYGSADVTKSKKRKAVTQDEFDKALSSQTHLKFKGSRLGPPTILTRSNVNSGPKSFSPG